MKHLITGKLPALATASALACMAGLTAGFLPIAAQAQNFPVTPTQRETAQQVAQTGVPLGELAAGAPDQYTVKSGDTLWAIAGLYLKKPWRWPELWGMNLEDIRNPHLIFPGQVLYLEKKDGRARLTTIDPLAPSGREGAGNVTTVRISPSVRVESAGRTALPTLKNSEIEALLVEPMLMDAMTLALAPRIVATQEGRVLLSRGDRAYALGDASQPLLEGPGLPQRFSVFRNPRELKDPLTGEILGYEAEFVGKALLENGQTVDMTPGPDGKPRIMVVPATISILRARDEIAIGDRLLPEPPRPFVNYMPHAPAQPVDARVIGFYGSTSVRYASQSQVVVINRGTRDGMESGQILSVVRPGRQVVDNAGGARTVLQLPDWQLGMLMVFSPFEKVSYGLLLQVADGVQVGDKLVNPR
jgi:hypothetical protein